jgi:hypothetical protein
MTNYVEIRNLRRSNDGSEFVVMEHVVNAGNPREVEIETRYLPLWMYSTDMGKQIYDSASDYGLYKYLVDSSVSSVGSGGFDES